jgi:hypothetical protein
MGERGRCDIPTGSSLLCSLATAQIGQPIDPAPAEFFDRIQGCLGEAVAATAKTGTRADLVGSWLPSSAQSERRFEGFSESRLGITVAEEKPGFGGCDEAAAHRGRLCPEATCDSRDGSDPHPLTSRRMPSEKSWQHLTFSRRLWNWAAYARLRLRHERVHSGERFESIPPGEQSGRIHAFPYVERFDLTYVFEANRVLGLDPFDWLILLAGGTLSGVLVWLA